MTATFPAQAEIDQHLAAFSDAWKRYCESYHHPDPQLGHLEAVWECNTHLDWFAARGLKLWRDIVWEDRFQAFVLTEAIIG